MARELFDACSEEAECPIQAYILRKGDAVLGNGEHNCAGGNCFEDQGRVFVVPQWAFLGIVKDL